MHVDLMRQKAGISAHYSMNNSSTA